jgi:type II secretory pathway pseudopilin PulG
LGLALIPILAVCVIIAAIAIPSLLRPPMRANESAAIGRLRTVFNAQAAYALANGGSYDQLPCLVTPHDCIPGYPADGPTFLDGSFLSTVPQDGYDFRQDPGPAPRPETFDPRRSSPSSVMSFVLVAHPVEPGRTGVRHFCMDSTGYLCANRNRIGLLLDKGLCARTCRPVKP